MQPVHRTRALPRVPLAVLLLSVTIAGGGRLIAPLFDHAVTASDPIPPVAGAPDDGGDTTATDLVTIPAPGAGGDVGRIRANVAFWGDRLAAHPRDFVSATRLAASNVDLARATDDVTRYVAADDAIEAALGIHPDHPPARALEAVVLVALHRFAEARERAAVLLDDRPDDPVALSALGDAALELGDTTAAAGAYERLALVADSAAARVRLGRLAFLQGRTTVAAREVRSAVAAAIDEGASGSTLAWYHATLGDLLLATGDRVGGEAAFTAALAADPGLPMARAGRARLAAADGRLDDAIADLDAAIRVVPYPELLARRADLFDLRGRPGDDGRAGDDRATVLAIAETAGGAGAVYDRTLALFLATTGIDPERALRLARAEIEVRTDAGGYDALGWALLANGRAEEADAAFATALASGIRDARVLYHAGMAAIAVEDVQRGATLLRDALALDPTFDAAAAERARATLAVLP